MASARETHAIPMRTRTTGGVSTPTLAGPLGIQVAFGDYRVPYEFDVKLGRIYLHCVGRRREIYKRG